MHPFINQLFGLVKELDDIALENPVVYAFLEKHQLLSAINEIIMIGSDCGQYNSKIN